MKQRERQQTVVSVASSAKSAPYHDLRDFYARFGKRGIDLALAVPMLISVLPIMTVLALLSSLDGGAPIFGHERIGQNGRRFKCLKFRTMRTNSAEVLATLLASNPEVAAEWARDYKLARDPRITRVGRWLRRTSLDELPQLLNVIRGDMSLVGPRPITEAELEKYEGHISRYLALRPGMTGVWQVHGRGKVDYQQRVEMDARYAQTLSLSRDLWLVLLTTVVVFKRRGT